MKVSFKEINSFSTDQILKWAIGSVYGVNLLLDRVLSLAFMLDLNMTDRNQIKGIEQLLKSQLLNDYKLHKVTPNPGWDSHQVLTTFSRKKYRNMVEANGDLIIVLYR